MADVKFIRKDENGETVKIFTQSDAYQNLDAKDIIEIENVDGTLRDYVVTKKEWQFSHFGDMIIYTMEPAKWQKMEPPKNLFSGQSP